MGAEVSRLVSVSKVMEIDDAQEFIVRARVILNDDAVRASQGPSFPIRLLSFRLPSSFYWFAWALNLATNTPQDNASEMRRVLLLQSFLTPHLDLKSMLVRIAWCAGAP